jgi:hypothetical protein
MISNMTQYPLLTIGALGIAVLAVVCAACAITFARHIRSRQKSLEAALDSMRHDIEFIAGLSERNGQRLNTLESDAESFGDRIRLVELRSGSRSFDEAIDFARRGADANKLAEQFGLSGGEADLVTRLHRRART